MARSKTSAEKARPTNQARAATREIGFQEILYTGPLTGREGYIGGFQTWNLKQDLLRMSLMDETVGAMIWCVNSILAQVEWSHIPQVDGKDDEADEKAIAMATFADSMLIDMAHTMQEHVEEAASKIIFGHAPCEIVLKRRDGVASRYSDNLYGIAKLPLRDQMSITQWVYEGNDAVAFKQMTYRGTATIPLWKTLHYRTTSQLDRPEGRPLLLNAMRAWKLKEKIQDSEAIGIERDLVGLPTFRMPQEVIDAANETEDDGQGGRRLTKEAEAAGQMVRNALAAVRDMRFNKAGGLIIPSDTFASDDDQSTDRTPKWDFKLVTSGGQRTIDTRTAARDYDRAIARTLMMQFLHLGDRSTGSYAMSDDQSSMAVSSLMALAIKIAMEWNRKLLPLVWAVNGFDRRYMPRMRASAISKDGIQQIGALFSGLGRVAGLWETDVDLRMAIMKLVNLPADRDAQAAAAGRAAKAAENLAQPPQPPGQQPPGQGDRDEDPEDAD